MTVVLLLILQGRTSGGHGLLEAVPRIYQVPPDIPDRRRATKQKEVRPSPADSLKESQLAARSGPSPRRRTSPTPEDLNSKPLIASGRAGEAPRRSQISAGTDDGRARPAAGARHGGVCKPDNWRFEGLSGRLRGAVPGTRPQLDSTSAREAAS